MVITLSLSKSQKKASGIDKGARCVWVVAMGVVEAN